MVRLFSRIRNAWSQKSRPFEAKLPGQPAVQQGELIPTSPTWLYVSQWASEELGRARRLNDDTSLDAEQTAALRGEIKAYKKLLRLPDPQKGMPQVEVSEDPTFAGY